MECVWTGQLEIPVCFSVCPNLGLPLTMLEIDSRKCMLVAASSPHPPSWTAVVYLSCYGDIYGDIVPDETSSLFLTSQLLNINTDTL